jgi:DNA-binding HxlR family transcriptional regulator
MSRLKVRPGDGTPAPMSDFCPKFHRAVELVGRRWTGAIIRLLLRGPRRFCELSSSVPGISDRLLTQRLRELECEGIVRRVVDSGPPIRVDYALTECGAELDSMIGALASWADRWIPLKKIASRKQQSA